MSKKSTKALASAALMSLVLTTALSAGPVKAAQGEVTRVSGADRYATASQVATTNWADGSDNVVLVSGEGYADAVSASALAKKLDAPILLTKSDSLSADAQTALETLKPKNIYVVGGTASISQSIRDELAKSYTLTELGGANRYETNTAVAEELVKLGVSASDVLVVGGEGFSDALSVAPVAAAKGQILLLANNNSSQPAIDFVKENNSKVTVVGTSNVINDTVYNALGATTRVDGGTDRFDTNLKVLDNFKDSLKTDKLYIANATAATPDDLYADALVASAVAGKYSAPLVLVDKDPSGSTTNPNATDNAIAYLKDNTTSSTDFQVIGGTGVVSENTVEAIDDIYNNPSPEGEVKSIETNGLNEIKVVFNQEVDSDTAEDITNYKVDGTTLNDKGTKDNDADPDENSAKAVLQDDNKTVVIKLAKAQKQSDDIDVTVKKGILTADKSSTVPEYTDTVTFSDTTIPTVDSVEVKGNKKLTVKFSEPINVGTKADASGVQSKFKIDGKTLSSYGLNYDYSEASDYIKDVDGNYWTDEVDYYFDTALDSGSKTLKVSEGDKELFADAAGFPIAETTETFDVDTLTSTPEIKSITASDDGKVKINFDRPMDPKTATKIGNYEINDGNVNIDKDPELKEGDTQVKLTVTGLNKGSNKLYIDDNVKDAYGNNIEEDTYESFELEEDTTKPSVTSVYALDDDTIRVRFSKDVDSDYATNTSNYKLRDSDGTDITDEIDKIIPAGDSGASTADVFDINLKSGKKLTDSKYTIRIENIQDKASTPNVIDTYEDTFDGSDEVNAKVEGVYAVSGSNGKKIAVVFNKEMDASTLTDTDNYEYVNAKGDTKTLPSSADITSNDDKSATIDLDDTSLTTDEGSGKADENIITAIYATGVKDANGNSLQTGRDGADITTPTGVTKAKANSLKVYYEDNDDDLKVDVIFETPIDSDTLEASDFTFGTVKADSAKPDGKVVTLTFKSDDDDQNADTNINNIKKLGNDAVLTIKENSATKDVSGQSVTTADASGDKPYFYEAAPRLVTVGRDSKEAPATNWSAGLQSDGSAIVSVKFDTPIDGNSVNASDFKFNVGGTTINADSAKVDENDARTVNFKFNKDNKNIGEFKDAETIKVTPQSTVKISTEKDANDEYAYYVPTDDDYKGIIVNVTNAASVDKSSLTSAISVANTDLSSVTVSADGTDVPTSEQWVTSAAKEAYTNAIAEAQTVVDKEDATQAQVNDAISALATATTTFDSAKQPGTQG
ncbi:cell wall-binding repeat-containing protein [Clostridium luticellarii]|jgi:putative cell wall-binding protein|uniref:cell wall-binding repeat-containing protein n=2 Tax=Clostridium luticellarii TaxID=1691940 RepID=UPI002357E7F7|nr:cell wall-binding repeat-containing protein [Clostridium luticellarii]MCI1946129.1 cell wall-binding repeat-containing protein [Clostridium luticellarii]